MVNKIIRRSILVCIAVISAVYYLTHYDGGEYTKDNIDDYVRRMCEVYHIPGLPR